MKHLWKRAGAAGIALLLLSGCSATEKAQMDSQGDLMSAYRKAIIGDTPAARNWVDLAIKADPNDSDLYVYDPDSSSNNNTAPEYTIAFVFAAVNDDASLIYYMRKAVQQFPKDYLPLKTILDTEEVTGDTVNLSKDATALVALLQTQISLPANSQEVKKMSLVLAQALCDSGNSALGEQKYRSVIATNPSDPDAYNGLAYYIAVQNDTPHLKEALSDINTAITLVKSSSYTPKPDEDVADDVAEFEDTQAWVQYRLGDLTDAEEQSELAVNDMPDEPVIRYHLAMIYKALGKSDAAQVELNRALTLDPAYADAIAANNQLQGAPPTPPIKTAMAVGPKTTTEVQ